MVLVLKPCGKCEEAINGIAPLSAGGEVVLTRDEAIDLVKKNVAKRNVVYHMLAVEAIMRGTARHFGEDENKWGLIGLLHDVDYEKTEATPEKHTLLAEEILKGFVPDELIKAIKTHNFKHTGVIPETRVEKALIASDAISGLLVACALVMPSKKLADVKVETVSKKFKDKDFARGAERERILVCEEIEVPREKFFEIALNGLKSVAAEIGL
jgi:putative nucleotidyltransferase with HDIG domain